MDSAESDNKEELRERYEATADERYYELARPLYEQALADSPGDARLLADWGFLQECHGRSALRSAAECYRRAIEADPSLDKAHYQLISSLRALGDLDTVIPRYERMVASAPADPRGHRLLSMAYLGAGEHENAAAAIDAGLRIAPDDTLLTELRGDLYAATGRPEDALASWRRDGHAANCAAWKPNSSQAKTGPQPSKRIRPVAATGASCAPGGSEAPDRLESRRLVREIGSMNPRDNHGSVP